MNWTERAGCKPTYEGLKVVLRDSHINFLLGCKPTYEGLKERVRQLSRWSAAWLQAYI